MNKEEYENSIKFCEILNNSYNEYKEEIKRPSCDKKELSFNNDDRFKIFTLDSLFISNYTGYYGSSSCSSVISISNKKLFEEYFIKVLNKMIKEIFEKIIVECKADIAKKKEEKIKELEEMIKNLKNNY